MSSNHNLQNLSHLITAPVLTPTQTLPSPLYDSTSGTIVTTSSVSATTSTITPASEQYFVRVPRPRNAFMSRNFLRYLRRPPNVLTEDTATYSSPASSTSPLPTTPTTRFSTSPNNNLTTSPVTVPTGSASSSSLRYRHHNASFGSHLHPPTPDTQLKPIYIYPGLLRIVRDKAIALDNQCPAVLYKCRDCRRDRDRDRDRERDNHSSSTATKDPITDSERTSLPQEQPLQNPNLDDTSSTPASSNPESNSSPAFTCPPRAPGRPADAPHVPLPERDRCPHQTSCAICLEEFHSKDLVRKLPCNVNHVFHSKCILDWFVSHHRCPLCNETVAYVSTDLRTISSNPVSSTSSATLASTTSPRVPAPHDDSDRRSRFHQHRRMASDFLAEVRRARVSRVPRSPSDSTQTATSHPSSSPPSQSQRPHPRNRSNGRRRSTLRAALASVSRHSPTNNDHLDIRRRADVSPAPTRSLPPRPLSTPVTSHSSNISGPVYARRGGSLRHAVGDRSVRVNPAPARLAQDATSSTHDSNPRESTRTDACHDVPPRTTTETKSCDPASDRAKKKPRGPRTYSYIVHDNVRMEMNPVIPV